MKSMWNWIWVGVVLIALALALGADEVKKPKDVFSSFKVGQSVTLKDEGSALRGDAVVVPQETTEASAAAEHRYARFALLNLRIPGLRNG